MTNAEPNVLLLAVIYRNHGEVEEFCRRLKETNGDDVRIVVCDNSPRAEQAQILNADLTVGRPDNPGYLDGGIEALKASLEAGWELPAWTALSNTDLDFGSGRAFLTLGTYDPSKPIIIAPSILEGASMTEKNPHVLQPRSRLRHRLNRIATYTPTVAIAYLAVSALRVRGRTSRPTPPAPSDGRMYSPYGALIIFSNAFVSRFGLPAGVPLLAEEWAVAEHARSTDTPVVFEPRISVLHDPHSTTGGKVTRRRGAMLSRAFRHVARGWKGHDVWTP